MSSPSDPVHTPLPIAELETVYYGRIVTMDEAGVIDDGALYVSAGVIRAVQNRNLAAPNDFNMYGATRVETGGTIFPGLIELHNHKAFNVLSMAVMDQKYTNRDQWRPSPVNGPNGSEMYAALVGAPMLRLINAVPAVSTYVDTKAVVAGLSRFL